jgi:UDP-glucose 4-epimerase
MAWSSDASDELFEANVRATHLLLREAAKASPGLSRFVLASSDDTYPSLAHTTGLVTEDEPQHPVSFYGATKVMGEDLALHYWYAQAMPVVVTRFCLVARSDEILRPDGWSGRFLFASSLAGFFSAVGRPECAELIRAASREQDECLLLARDESGEPYSFHFADVRDIVAGLLLALDRPEAAGETFNLAGPEPFSYGVAVPSLSRASGIPFVDLSLPGPPIRVGLDISKARRLLGYKPIWTVEAVIADAVRHPLPQPEAFG